MTEKETKHTDAVWRDQYLRMVWIEASLITQREILKAIAPHLSPEAQKIIEGYDERFDGHAKSLKPAWQNAFPPGI